MVADKFRTHPGNGAHNEAICADRRKVVHKSRKHYKGDRPVIDLSAAHPLSTINRSAASRAISINVSNISRILSTDPSQRRTPQLHTFYRLARYLSLTMDQLYELLYSGSDDRKPSP